eukprot:CAMPEP_0175974102 /NCGR_PEP_ID=MMETSP0108-20121206/43183_1 /TAXON_ID=195067 ORGANISM="Goniomonas pacifica, Strain CCMP1869" /NCGR_SAMPLE_ID=MMETSP0108 /ASSEMBLY_ACC=CAM_ASM_000204 /LENGTH=131 /DNA_ID=CAMNT_0017303663 /DNA_START=6 /DNA_END=399 /DNA_ORIENTATION=-
MFLLDEVDKYHAMLPPSELPDTSGVKAIRLACLLNVAQCHILRKAWGTAVEATTAALAVDSQSVKALYRRAVARTEQGELQAASADLKNAVAIGGETPELRRAAANVERKNAAANSRQRQAFGKMFGSTCL